MNSAALQQWRTWWAWVRSHTLPLHPLAYVATCCCSIKAAYAPIESKGRGVKLAATRTHPQAALLYPYAIVRSCTEQRLLGGFLHTWQATYSETEGRRDRFIQNERKHDIKPSRKYMLRYKWLWQEEWFLKLLRTCSLDGSASRSSAMELPWPSCSAPRSEM